MKIATIVIRGNHFVMHPNGAMYWEEKKAILIADVHLGKITHFRKYGSAVSNGVIKSNFDKLDKVVNYFKPEEVYFLGDLFHSYLNTEWGYFRNWVAKSNVKITLITGNHDIIPKSNFLTLGIKVVKELLIDLFILTHYPLDNNKSFYNFCGHIHPGVTIKGFGKQKIKLPCFFQKENQLILPAFGDFTGNFELKVEENCKAYVIADDELILVH